MKYGFFIGDNWEDSRALFVVKKDFWDANQHCDATYYEDLELPEEIEASEVSENTFEFTGEESSVIEIMKAAGFFHIEDGHKCL